MNELTANTRTLEIFPWNENLCTGIEEIDVQHKRLVELLNVLVSHLAFNADTPTLNNVFDELKNYTVVHFFDRGAHLARAFQAGPVGGVAPRRARRLHRQGPGNQATGKRNADGRRHRRDRGAF